MSLCWLSHLLCVPNQQDRAHTAGPSEVTRPSPPKRAKYTGALSRRSPTKNSLNWHLIILLDTVIQTQGGLGLNFCFCFTQHQRLDLGLWLNKEIRVCRTQTLSTTSQFLALKNLRNLQHHPAFLNSTQESTTDPAWLYLVSFIFGSS